MYDWIPHRLTISLIAITLLLVPVTGGALDDPTKPAFLQKKKRVVKKSVPLKPLTVNSILYSSQRQVAVINDTVLAVGERIEDAMVMEIGRHFVVLKRRGAKVVMNVADDSEVKRRRIDVAPVSKESE